MRLPGPTRRIEISSVEHSCEMPSMNNDVPARDAEGRTSFYAEKTAQPLYAQLGFRHAGLTRTGPPVYLYQRSFGTAGPGPRDWIQRVIVAAALSRTRAVLGCTGPGCSPADPCPIPQSIGGSDFWASKTSRHRTTQGSTHGRGTTPHTACPRRPVPLSSQPAEQNGKHRITRPRSRPTAHEPPSVRLRGLDS